MLAFLRRLILALVILVAIGTPLYWLREPILVGMGKWLVVESPLQKADLVVALGGARERQEKAVDLLKQGFARRIMFTGPDFRPHDYSCLGIAKEGIPPPEVAYRTYEDVLTVKTVMEQRGFQSAIIVTSPYHLRRTRLIFTRVFDGAEFRLGFYPSTNSAFSMNNWWKSHYGRKSVLIEYVGIVYYWILL